MARRINDSTAARSDDFRNGATTICDNWDSATHRFVKNQGIGLVGVTGWEDERVDFRVEGLLLAPYLGPTYSTAGSLESRAITLVCVSSS